jgi:hypothetical protein
MRVSLKLTYRGYNGLKSSNGNNAIFPTNFHDQVTTMRGYKRFSFVALATMIIIFSAGCGGNATSTPTPTGGFSNASINGAYAFSFSGNDVNGFFAVAGTLTANGGGQITSGVIDINRVGGVFQNIGLTGTYATRADGRGVATLTTAAGNFSLAFSILNANRVLITRFETGANGSGAMDLQNPGAFSTAALAGQFAFNLSGVDTAGNPFATVGSVTTNAAGTVTGGIQDSSDDGAILQAAPITAGTIAVATNGRGTASLSTASGVLNFAFYVVDANQIKLVETDATPVLAGDAFRQNGTFSNATLSGPFAFTIGGANLAAPFAAGGVLTSNGAGAITSGIEDVNNGGTANTNLTLSGTYTLAANGRGTALLATGLGNINLAFYPTTKGVQVLETDTGLIANGAAFQQTGSLSSATVSGNYAMNFTGVSTTGALDAVSEFNANGNGALSGIIDINNFGSLSTGTSITGNYSVSADGRGPLTFVTGPLGQQNLAIYVIDSTHAIFIDLDSTIVTLGEMDHR